jgi:hypothetical protein
MRMKKTRIFFDAMPAYVSWVESAVSESEENDSAIEWVMLEVLFHFLEGKKKGRPKDVNSVTLFADIGNQIAVISTTAK